MAHSKSCGVRWASAILLGSCYLFAQSAPKLEHVGVPIDRLLVQSQTLPPWWDTWPSRLGGAVGVGLIVWGGYRLRVAQLARQLNLRFEERLMERSRVAEELHDALLQGFLSASMQLDVAAGRLPPDSPVRQQLNHVLELMRTVSMEGRRALQNLRSPESVCVRLELALAQVEQEFAHQAGGRLPAVRIAVEGLARPMHPLLRDEVYRIGREAMVNALRHSRATRIEVVLEYSKRQFRFVIHDDGRGIDREELQNYRGDRGLSGMHKRAEGIGGRLRLWSRDGMGTRIELSVPGRIAFQPLKPDRQSSVFSWRHIVQFLRTSLLPAATNAKVLGRDYKPE